MRILQRAALGLLISVGFAAAAHADWTRSDFPQHGFSAAFPRTPDEEARTANGTTLHTISTGDPRGFCIVVVDKSADIKNPDVELVASRYSFPDDFGGKVGVSKRFSYRRGAAKLPALEFDAANATHRFLTLIVIDGAKAYQVMAGVPNVGGDSGDLERCVRGFKLTGN